jgi:hypothetical protein
MSTNLISPPLDPLLIPVSPLSQDQETEKTSKAGLAAVLTLPSLVTPEELAQMRSMDVEEAIRASAFLLDWASRDGSNEVNGCLAIGIAQALELCADRIGEERERES